MSATKEGRALVEAYYDIAPTIVKRINRQPDRDQIYQKLYQEYLLPCIDQIEAQEYEACKAGYQEMVLALKEKYMG